MGRETKILLTLLGLLAGVFMGVVALKLFVPRPPEGTGPDIDMASEPLPLVDPPAFEPSTLDPPLFAPPAQPAPVASADPYSGRTSRFGAPAPPDIEEPPRDLAVVPISYEQVVEPPATDAPPSFNDAPQPQPEPPAAFLEPPRSPPQAAFPVAAPRHGPAPGDSYVTRDGDSWWSLAEAAYGDGRLYRALYAWNRNLNERVSLVPGTTLDIPPEANLGAAWSTLLPTD